MRNKLPIILLLVTMLSVSAKAIETTKAQAFVGQDLRLVGTELLNYQLSSGRNVLVFQDNFSMSIGANNYSCDKAVVWLNSQVADFRGKNYVDYAATIYLSGNIKTEKGKAAKTVDIIESPVEADSVMVIRFRVSGGVFVTANKRQEVDPRQMDLYKNAMTKVEQTEPKPKFVVQREAIVPQWYQEKSGLAVVPSDMAGDFKPADQTGSKYVEAGTSPVAPGSGFVESVIAEEKSNTPAEPEFSYPVNISPAGATPLDIERSKLPDGSYVATLTERFYIWQKRDEKGGLVELQADNAVIFYSSQDQNSLNNSDIESIYMSGDIVMTEGSRTIRADEMYYNFREKKGVAINAEMRNFDTKRNIPLYVRAARLQRVSENKFAAENVIITSSEFYHPQVSATVSQIIVTDTTSSQALSTDQDPDSGYDAKMHDFKMKVGNTTVFRWPYIHSDLQRPDIPIKSLKIGNDSNFGTSVETRWYLSRLLGLKEPEGVDSTLAADYFGKRGTGVGAEIDYRKENYFGEIKSYIIKDSGEDDLGRYSSRRNQESPRELRGRFSWQHRQFLPYNWQLTTGVGYLSDENFIEGYFRNEFNIGKNETYVHLKRLQDNWAVSFLGKSRINDFSDEMEELPTVEYHLTGQSLFDDKFTLYSDTQVSRLRQRIGDNHLTNISQEMFSFLSHRTELDMPLQSGPYKIVPFAAGTFGYDDRSGFRSSLVDGTNSGTFGQDQIWIAELGIRASSQYWKVYPDVKSRLWDLNQIRHIITPEITITSFAESDSVVDQRDSLNLALRQRLQTKRGAAGQERTVDWMRLNMDVTFLKNQGDSSAGPDNYLWANPIVPLHVFSAPSIFNGDLETGLERFAMYGPRRNYFGADYAWKVTDTTALSSDINYDMQSGVVQQFDIGISRLVWPNLSYYIGSRYLRRVNVLNEFGSNAFTFSATYILDSRYTLVFSQQYDFDYGANIRSDLTLVRKYHRLCYGLTYSVDESLKNNAIVLSVWPMGVKELAFGDRSYVELGGAAGY